MKQVYSKTLNPFNEQSLKVTQSKNNSSIPHLNNKGRPIECEVSLLWIRNDNVYWEMLLSSEYIGVISVSYYDCRTMLMLLNKERLFWLAGRWCIGAEEHFHDYKYEGHTHLPGLLDLFQVLSKSQENFPRFSSLRAKCDQRGHGNTGKIIGCSHSCAKRAT